MRYVIVTRVSQNQVFSILGACLADFAVTSSIVERRTIGEDREQKENDEGLRSGELTRRAFKRYVRAAGVRARATFNGRAATGTEGDTRVPTRTYLTGSIDSAGRR